MAVFTYYLGIKAWNTGVVFIETRGFWCGGIHWNQGILASPKLLVSMKPPHQNPGSNETQHMVNFGQKTAIFNLWNSRQKKIPPKWLETTLVSQKKTNLNFETTLVSQKKTIFKNTSVNRHVESAESTNSSQRRRPFWERKRVDVD